MLLYGDKRREVVLAWAQIIDMNSFVVFIVILEFLVYLYLKALSISHYVHGLSILVDLPQALLGGVLGERESDCGVDRVFGLLQVQVLLSLAVDSFDSDIVNIDSFLLEIGCHELLVFQLMLVLN